MKIKLLIGTVMAFLIVCSVGCTANIEAQKNQAKAIRELGEAYLAEGKYTAAYQQLVKAEKLDPRDPYVHYALGNFYYGKGKYNQAIEEYKKALTLNPYYSGEIYNSLGIVYVQKKMFKSAEEAFNKALELNPQDSITKNNLFELHKMIGQMGAAITHP